MYKIVHVYLIYLQYLIFNNQHTYTITLTSNAQNKNQM